VGREVGRPINLLEALTELAFAYVGAEPAFAAQLLAAADAAYAEREIVRPAPEGIRVEQCWTTLSSNLDRATLARSKTAGSRLGLDQAIKQVLATRA
jgi:hypothetical protein